MIIEPSVSKIGKRDEKRDAHSKLPTVDTPTSFVDTPTSFVDTPTSFESIFPIQSSKRR